MESTNPTYFPDVVGQKDALRMLSFYIDAHKIGEVIPNLLLLAPKGTGKSLIIKQFGKLLNKPMYGMTGDECTSIKAMWYTLEPIFSSPEACTIFVDEVHGMSRAVADWLLPALNPNREHKNLLTYLGNSVEVDFNKITFIFASTEPQSIRPALRDRMTQVSLDIYSKEEIASIIRLNMLDAVFENDALNELSLICRGNGRSAQKIGQALNSFLAVKNSNTFPFEWIEEFMSLIGAYPLGLDKQELLILKHISKYPKGVTLSTLCALTEYSVGAFRNMENYLRKNNLIENAEASKRFITQQGREYLQKVTLFEEKINGKI